MATIFDVADYILDRCGSMTTMKLQKLCYYSQAWSLVWEEVPIFDEDFEAWANGPVCRRLFETHRGIFRLDKDFFRRYGSRDNLTDAERGTIDSVIEYYGDWEPQELSQLTLMENPWIKAREGVSTGENCGKVIDKESMQQYYSGLVGIVEG